MQWMQAMAMFCPQTARVAKASVQKAVTTVCFMVVRTRSISLPVLPTCRQSPIPLNLGRGHKLNMGSCQNYDPFWGALND